MVTQGGQYKRGVKVTELNHSNDNRKNDENQESWQEYQARISTPGYQSPLVHPDDSPLTLQEHLQLILNDIEEASPAEPLGMLVVKALRAMASIPREISDLNYPLQEIADGQRKLIDLVAKIEHHLRDIKDILNEPPYQPPYQPSLPGRGSGKPRIEVSPGLKRLRKSLKEGG